LIATCTEPPPPPPPFDAIPERPLFAPDPADGSPVRRPRQPVGAGPGAGRGGFWPWDSSTSHGSRVSTGSGYLEAVDDEDDFAEDPPGRSWLRLAALVGLLALVLLAVVFAFNIGRGRTPLGGEPQSGTSSSGAQDSPSSSAGSGSPGPSAAPYPGITATDFDPQGDPPEENPDLVPLAVDGDPSTAWRTMTYSQQLGPGGLKTGVGMTLDLGATGTVSELDLTLVGTPTTLSVYVTPTAPTGIKGLTPAATQTVDGTDATIALDPAPSGRYVTVWLTSLPAVPGGYRGAIAEATVIGTPAG
jgi:hypothetical protein